MSEASLWRACELREDALVLRVERASSAGALAQALLQSKAAVRRVLARGQLSRAGAALPPTASCAEGDVLELAFEREEAPAAPSSGSDDLRVVYQDPVLLVADKPAGLLVHGDGTGSDTLTARVRAHLVRQGSAAVPQAVQRLDMETTGLVLFSLTREFQPALDAQVAGHDMRKRYLAVIEGSLEGSEDGWRELRWPIARDRHDARRMRAGQTGKPALTRVHTLAREGGHALLLVELGSGRRHQIRVHLARAGRPIVGDALYGGARCTDGLMLHAFEERLTHPVTGEMLTLSCEPPQRFVRLFPRQLG